MNLSASTSRTETPGMLAVFGVVVVGRGGGWRRMELDGVSWSLGGREKQLRGGRFAFELFGGAMLLLARDREGGLFRRGADQTRLARESPDHSQQSRSKVAAKSQLTSPAGVLHATSEISRPDLLLNTITSCMFHTVRDQYKFFAATHSSSVRLHCSVLILCDT